MAIQTRPQQKNSQFVHIVIAAAATTALMVATIVPLSRSSSERPSTDWSLGASIVPATTASERFAEEMALHEALTEAQFGPLQVSEAALAVAAIAEHEALIEPFLISTSAPVRDDTAEIARAIAEHEALIQTFVS